MKTLMRTSIAAVFAMLTFGAVAPSNAQSAPIWSEVARTEVCTPARNAPMCIHGEFKVNNKGAFQFTSDAYPHKSGTLSDSDFQELAKAATAVDFRFVRVVPTCEGVMGIPEVSANKVAITYTNWRTKTVKELSNGRLCYLIERQKTDQLDSVLKRLTAAYGGPWEI